MARFLALIVCAVAAVASWSAISLAFVSGLPGNSRSQRGTMIPMSARGGGATIAVPSFKQLQELDEVDPATRSATWKKWDFKGVTPAAKPEWLVRHSEMYGDNPRWSFTNPKVSKKKGGGKVSTFGIFSPLVEVAKAVLGEEELNTLRGDGIKLHSTVITGFTGLESKAAATGVFKLADKNGNGTLDLAELRAFMKTCGFRWLDDDEKIIATMGKFDKDGNQVIDLQEFLEVAPTVFRQNLIKLAKKNGDKLGFLV